MSTVITLDSINLYELRKLYISYCKIANQKTKNETHRRILELIGGHNNYYSIVKRLYPNCRLCERLSSSPYSKECIAGNHGYISLDFIECRYHPEDPHRFCVFKHIDTIVFKTLCEDNHSNCWEDLEFWESDIELSNDYSEFISNLPVECDYGWNLYHVACAEKKLLEDVSKNKTISDEPNLSQTLFRLFYTKEIFAVCKIRYQAKYSPSEIPVVSLDSYLKVEDPIGYSLFKLQTELTQEYNAQNSNLVNFYLFVASKLVTSEFDYSSFQKGKIVQAVENITYTTPKNLYKLHVVGSINAIMQRNPPIHYHTGIIAVIKAEHGVNTICT